YDLDPSMLNTLMVEMGNGDDQLDLDPTIPGLAALSIQIFGGGGRNSFSMVDNGDDDVLISPSNLQSFSFTGIRRFDTTLNLSGGAIIHLQEFQEDSVVHLDGFKSLTYAMPQFLGDNFNVTARAGSGLTIPPSAGGTDMVIAGTAGPTFAVDGSQLSPAI